MIKVTTAAFAALCISLPLAALSEEGGGGGGDVQAKPKELTAPGTKGSKLKVDPKNNPAATKAAPVEGSKTLGAATTAAGAKEKAALGK